MTDENQNDALSLELGDIIRIISANNDAIHNKTYVIEFVDDALIKLINIDDLSVYDITLLNGRLTDESITAIEILARAEEKGYSRQHGLIPDAWINVHFGGDVPVIITGKITDLEEDMIELEIYPNGEKIYIDFGYRGIPKDIPIERIELRNAPADVRETLVAPAAIKNSPKFEEFEGEPEPEQEDEHAMEAIEEVAIDEDADAGTDKLREAIQMALIDADEIIFGEELEDLDIQMELPDEQKRYSIEEQTSDLLDELLSTVPNSQRTGRVLDEIHRMIDRFKQLRALYSTFDSRGTAYKSARKGSVYKPMAEKLSKLSQSIAWITPIVQNKRRLFKSLDAETEEGLDAPNDAVVGDMLEHVRHIRKINTEYKSRDVAVNSRLDTYLRNMWNEFSGYDNELDEPKDVIYKSFVNANMDVVIDNLENIYSSVRNNREYMARKYVVARYNLGLKKLTKIETLNRKFIYEEEPIIDADVVNLRGIIVAPKSFITYSRVSLPMTNMLMRAQLHKSASPYMNMWSILRQSDVVDRVIIDNENIEDYELEFTDRFREFIINASSFEHIDPDDRFGHFMKTIIPKTRNIFAAMAQDLTIGASMSMGRIINSMEGFGVYMDNISYKLYADIVKYVKQRVADYKQQYVAKAKTYEDYAVSQFSVVFVESVILSLLRHANATAESNVIGLYGLKTPMDKTFFGDIIGLTNEVDYSRLLYTTIANQNRNLYMNVDIDGKIREIQTAIKTEGEKAVEVESDKCGTNFILAKKYLSIKDLEFDNGADVYFDYQLDPTRYDIMNEYRKERDEMDAPQFIDFLAQKLQQNIGLTMEMAKYEATSMVNKKRQVRDGHYAVLEVEQGIEAPVGIEQLPKEEQEGGGVDKSAVLGKFKFYYYQRKDGRWILDEVLTEKIKTIDNTLFCNFSDQCMAIKNQCVSLKKVESNSVELSLKKMIGNWDKEIEYEYQMISATLQMLNDDARNKVRKLRRLVSDNKLKYDRAKWKLGETVSGDVPVSSPYVPLRDQILGQYSFTKKQNDIIQFCNRFTRDATDDENPHWKYCIESNKQLIPAFLYELAMAFVTGVNYQKKLDEVVATIGVLADNGDAIVDKHSGFVIRAIDFSNVAEFDEAGFKVVGGDVEEATVFEEMRGEVQRTRTVKADDPDIEKTINEMQYNEPETEMIHKVIMAICDFMGIKLSASMGEFVIRNVKTFLTSEEMQTPEKYAKVMAALKAKGQKAPPFEDVYNQFLLFFTLAYLLIAIEASIPSVRSRKTFPNCVKSFVGYPVYDDSDMSAFEYLMCVVDKMKSSMKPYNVIKSMKYEALCTKMKAIVERAISNPEAKLLSDKKRAYLVDESAILAKMAEDEHSIQSIRNFLPSLNRVANISLQSVSGDFKSKLYKEIKEGAPEQLQKLNVLVSKVILYGYGIQEAIEGVVGSETLELRSASGAPFIENVCCNNLEMRKRSALEYFVDKNKTIGDMLETIRDMETIHREVIASSKPYIFIDTTAEKTINLTPIADGFSESAIFLAFMHYCAFNKNMPVPLDLAGICQSNSSAYSAGDTLEDKIAILKNEGRNFNLENMDMLIGLISRRSVRPIKAMETIYSNKTKLEYALKKIRGEEMGGGARRKTVKSEEEDDDDVVADTKIKWNQKAVVAQNLKNMVKTTVITEEFVNILLEVVDRYDTRVENLNDPSLKKLRTYLLDNTERMTREITSFFKTYANLRPAMLNTYEQFVRNIMKYKYEDYGQTEEVKKGGAPKKKEQTVGVVEEREVVVEGLYMTNEDEATFKAINNTRNFIIDVLRSFPLKIQNDVNADDDVENLSMPRTWQSKFSSAHLNNLGEIVMRKDYSSILRSFMDNDALKVLLEEVRVNLEDFELLMRNTHMLASVNGVMSYMNSQVSRELFAYYFVLSIWSHIDVIKRKQKEIERRHSNVAKTYMNLDREDGLIMRGVDVAPIGDGGVEASNDDTSLFDFTTDELPKQLARLLTTYLDVFIERKTFINTVYKEVRANVQTMNDDEKRRITTYLENLTDEERAVDNVFKKHKLGRWGVGMEKALTQYVKSAYDADVQAIEEQIGKEGTQLSLLTRLNAELYGLKRSAVDDQMTDGEDLIRDEFDLSVVYEDGEELEE